MPIEIYTAILVACSCIVVLTASFLIAAMYFKARVSAMEKQVAQLEGDLSGLIQESQGFIRKMQLVAARAAGAMEDVEQMTHTTRGWTDRTDRILAVVATLAELRTHSSLKNMKLDSRFLVGVMQALLTQGNES